MRVAERVERILKRETPAWGIRPVPAERRRLGGLDLGVLWFDLSVGLLVMVTGALLVPALGLGTALLAIAVGTLLGCVPLTLVALATLIAKLGVDRAEEARIKMAAEGTNELRS